MRKVLYSWTRINVPVLLLLGLSAAAISQSAAQSLKAERDAFAATKAKAEKGDARAQLEFGLLYTAGEIVPQDPKKAVKWHRKAAEQGLAAAQHQLALDYVHGFGVKADPEEAFRWFRRAAEGGLAEAQVNLGVCYLKGRGVPENAVEAAYWFRKAAEQGDSDGVCQLAKCYYEGRGVSVDISEAYKWLRQAAEQGNAAAQRRLGLCFEKGEAVGRDFVQAHKWYNLAAAQDDANAPDIRVSIAKIETSLSKEQIAEAQRLAREFKPFAKPRTGSGGLAADPGTAGGSGAATGFVNLKGDDESGEIYVDGAYFGNPPARLKLADGTHVIEVKKQGFKTYHKEVTVSGGSDLNLRVSLEKQ
jgi:TPR repeat protein